MNKIHIEVFERKGFSDGTTIFSQQIEGNDFYTEGYIDAVKEIYNDIEYEVIITEL